MGIDAYVRIRAQVFGYTVSVIYEIPCVGFSVKPGTFLLLETGFRE